jgi:hypothetical protein
METVRIRDGNKLDPGSGINITNPGSDINITDPQHCKKNNFFVGVLKLENH